MDDKVVVRNIASPGHVTRLDGAKYRGMRDALMQVVTKAEPGHTVAELSAAIAPHQPQDLFPGGAKAGWWLKAVQLDLEAQGILVRTRTSPLRLRLA